MRATIKEKLGATQANVLFKHAILETRILTRFLIRQLNIPEEAQNKILTKAFEEAERKVND